MDKDCAYKREDNLVYLYLEIDNRRCTEKETKILKQYAGVKYGETISRYIVMPQDMHLEALHYAIQRLFGWIDRYRYAFKLPDDVFYSITKDNVCKWASLTGDLFSYIWSDNEAGYFNPLFQDNKEVDIEEFFAQQYTGPYIAGYRFSKMHSVIKTAVQMELEKLSDNNDSVAAFNIENLSTFTSGDVKKDDFLKENANTLLPCMYVSSVLAAKGEKVGTDQEIPKHGRYYRNIEDTEVLPLTHKLIYTYGGESKWVVNIVRLKNFSSLIEDGLVCMSRVNDAENAVKEKHRPFCVFKDGANVLDDVDDLPGYCEFLHDIFEGCNIEKMKKALKFGRRRDWHIEEMNEPIIL